MSIAIDDATGLPDLPEGQWWEVAEVAEEKGGEERWPHGAFFSSFTPKHHQVRIMRTIEVPESRTYRDRGWWRSNELVVVPAYTRNEVVAKIVVGEWIPPKLEQGFSLGDYMAYEPSLTPELVLKYAKKLIKRLEHERDAKIYKERKLAEEKAAKAVAEAVTNSLLGAYPPKSLKKVGAA